MPKGRARAHRQIRELKERVVLEPNQEDECVECGGIDAHASWCLAEEEDNS